MSETILGLNAFTEQPIQRKWTYDKGWTVVRTWEGPQAQAQAYALTLQGLYNPDSINVTEGVPATITLEFAANASASGEFPGNQSDDAGDEEESAVWELLGTELEKKLGTHPAFNKSLSTDAMKESVENAIRRGTASATDWDTDYSGFNMQAYATLRLRGTDSYSAYYWIIRRTTTTTRRSQVRRAMLNIFSVVTYSDPEPVGMGLPVNNAGKVKWNQPSIDSWDGSTKTPTLITQWLKRPPLIRQSGTKYIITQDWWGAEHWSKILYSGGDGTP